MKKYIMYLPFLAWMQAIAATVGSLFFSEVWKLPPCTLCWYQRIFMYPLVILIPFCIWKRDKNLPGIVLSLMIPGTVIVFFHNLLYYKIVPESAAPCTSGVSCTTKFFEWFGFVTIPLLSLCAFAFILVCMLICARYPKLWISKAKRK